MGDSVQDKEMETDQNEVQDSDSATSEFDEDNMFGESDSDPDSEASDTPVAFEEDEFDEDDPVVKAIRSAKDKKPSSRPPPIIRKGSIFGFTFHPDSDLITISTDEADVEM